jgi:hypothetical protein
MELAHKCLPVPLERDRELVAPALSSSDRFQKCHVLRFFNCRFGKVSRLPILAFSKIVGSVSL